MPSTKIFTNEFFPDCSSHFLESGSQNVSWPIKFEVLHNQVNIPCSGKVWWWKSLENSLILSILQKKVWQMNRFNQKVIIVSRNLDCFSLANHG